MNFTYNDGGRAAAGYKGTTGDCVCRSIAIVTGRPYQEVYDRLAKGNGKQKISKAEKLKLRNKAYAHFNRPFTTKEFNKFSKETHKKVETAAHGIYVKRQWFKDYMQELGLVWVPTMQIGQGCKVHLNENELPNGRLIVAVSRHYTAVIDGVIHDIYNPAERGSTIYPHGYPDLPKGAKPMENGNGYVYAPERCVYGYWKLNQQL